MIRCSYISDERVADNKSGNLSEVDDEVEIKNMQELAELGLNAHFSPAVFREHRRNKEHFISTQLIAYDFDDGKLRSQDIHEQLIHKFNHVILASKSWTLEKEKFHVFIPTNQPITDIELYKYIWTKLAYLNLWSVDVGCKDVTRYFYLHSGQLFVYDKAEPLELERFKKLKAAEESKVKKYHTSHFVYAQDPRSPLEKFKKTRFHKMLKDGLLRTDGNRYGISSQVIGCMKKLGLSDMEAMALFDEHATYGRSFTRESIVRRLNDFKK